MHEYALNESVRTNVIVIRGSVTPEQARELMVFLGRKKESKFEYTYLERDLEYLQSARHPSYTPKHSDSSSPEDDF